MTGRLLAAAIAVIALSLPTGAVAQEAPETALADVAVSDLTAAIDGADTVIIATEDAVDCVDECERLYTSIDGGRTWRRALAAGWSGAAPLVTVDGGTTSLVADGGDGVLEMSTNFGETFESIDIGGRLVGPGGRPDLVIAVDGDDLWAVRPATGAQTAFPLKLPADLDVSVTTPLTTDPEATFAGGVTADGVSQVAKSALTRCEIVWESDDSVVQQILADARADLVVILDGTGTVWVSADRGVTFRPRAVGLLASDDTTTITDAQFVDGALQVSVVVDGDPERTAFGDSGVYESVDSGNSWTRLGSHPALDRGAYAITVDRAGFVLAAYRVEAVPTRGVACFGDEGWAAICVGATATVGTSSSTTTRVVDGGAPTTGTSLVITQPLTDGGPSSMAKAASNAFFSIALLVLVGAVLLGLRGRLADRRRRGGE